MISDDCIYRTYGAADMLFECRDGEILVEGPAGTGKSRALLEKVTACADRYPGMRALLVRKTRRSMTESVMVTFERHVLLPPWKPARGASRGTRQAYLYGNGSSLVVAGMDRDSRIMSSEYDMALAFEARELTEADWESILSRLRNGRMPYQQAIADTNPDVATHWLNRRASLGKMRRLLSRHKDNPGATPAYLARLATLTGVRRLRLCDGIWAAAEGLVYDDWDPAIHLVQPFKLPASWRRIGAVDFGYTHPFVCQWWAIDDDGRMYLYRELYATQRLVEDHAREIRRLSEGERIEAFVADHDAEDRGTLLRYGVPTVAAVKAIRPGLQAVASRLRVAGDGRPRLVLFRDCLVQRDESLVAGGRPCRTEQEFAAYTWPPAGGEQPVDRDNHGLDALRYAVAYVDGLGISAFDFRVF